MILDGWGLGNGTQADVICKTPTPYMDYLNATYPHAQLLASGENVGLPDGQMGNSEVGHLNIGAGRVVYQDLVKVNRAIADGSIRQNPEIVAAYSYAKETGKKTSPYGFGVKWWCTQFYGTPVLSLRHSTRIWFGKCIRSLLYGWSRYRSKEWSGFYQPVGRAWR
jgi:hypothetical protein